MLLKNAIDFIQTTTDQPLLFSSQFTEVHMAERRQVQRTRVLKGAKIIFNDRASVMDCTVRNLTNLGACAQLASSLGIPQSFDLTFDSGRSNRKCQLIWRTENKLGISFK
jgi:hypothetical protein